MSCVVIWAEVCNGDAHYWKTEKLAMGALSDNRFVRVGKVPPVLEDVALCEVQVLYP